MSEGLNKEALELNAELKRLRSKLKEKDAEIIRMGKCYSLVFSTLEKTSWELDISKSFVENYEKQLIEYEERVAELEGQMAAVKQFLPIENFWSGKPVVETSLSAEKAEISWEWRWRDTLDRAPWLPVREGKTQRIEFRRVALAK